MSSWWIFRDIFTREFERWFFIKTRYIYFFLCREICLIFSFEDIEICKCLRYIVYIFVVHFFKSKYWFKLFRIFFRCQISWRGIFRYWNFPRGTTGRNFENSCSALSSSTLIFKPRTILRIEALKFWTLQSWMLRNALQF